MTTPAPLQRRRGVAALTAAAILAALLVLLPADPAAATTPAPVATVQLPANPLIGSTVNAQVTFSNDASSAVGFGPYVDLFLDTTGADGDDGVSFDSAGYLSLPVSSQTLTLACDGSDVHPFTGLTVTCPAGFVAGDTLTVLELPFGSFSPDQPAVTLDLSLVVSDLADLGEPLGVAVAAGFRYGANPLDDPDTDPPIVQNPPTAAEMTPTLAALSKSNAAPESETATGENYLRTWSLEVDLAPGQEVTDLVLSDSLPDTVAFAGVTSLSPGGTVVTTPPPSIPQLPPDNVVAAEWPTATDSVGMSLQFWVPRDDASGDEILDAETGAPRTIGNDASVTLTWTPLDPRDPTTTITLDPAGFEDTVTARSLATQKSVELVDDVGAPGATPGDTLEWTVEVQVSDYFAFADLTLSDVLSDGQSIDPSFTPALTVSTPGGSGPITGFVDHFTAITQGCAAGSPGTISILADLSAALSEQFPSTSGRFVGGDGAGATTAQIRYRTVIDTDYRCPDGAPAVNSDDRITNDVTLVGSVVDGATGAPSGSVVSDTSAAGVRIAAPNLIKALYAINGDTSSTGPEVSAGDVVTYRLRSSLPLTNVVTTSLTDYLPLPTFALPPSGLTVDWGAPVPPGPFAPTPWSITRGPDDTFTGSGAVTGSDPSLSVDQVNNSFTLDYSDYQLAPGDSPAVIDLLVNVVVSDERFADGLFLTNQVELTYADSSAATSNEAAIVQIQLTEPRLSITKGVVSTDRATGATFIPPVGPAGITWSAPGSPGARFTGGSLDSASLAVSPVASNLSGVDAGDVVTFAVVVENSGSGINGAFDVTVTDALPPGFSEPAGGWNLSVTDGAGSALAHTVDDPDAGPLGASLRLTDGSTGALAPYSPTAATNVAVITFDALLEDDARFAATLTNTAEVTNYSGSSGGPSFVTAGLMANADTLTAAPDTSKQIIATEMVPGTPDPTPRSTLTIGSLVSYRVTMTVPEGRADNVVLRDTLDPGLALVSLDSISASDSLSTSAPGGFPAALASATVSSVGSGTAAPGRRVEVDLGTLINSDSDNSAVETVTVEMTAVVLNVSGNTWATPTNRRNASTVLVEGAAVAPNRTSPPVTVVEPRIAVSKTASVDTADAGDTVAYTVTVTAASTPRASDAHDVTLGDVVPDGVTLVPGSFLHVAGVAPDTIDGGGSPLTVSWDQLAPGESSTLTYSVIVDADATSFGPDIVNTASAQWTSQPGSPSSASPHNTLGVERTGDPSDAGGSANTYRSQASAPVTVNSASVTKALTGTSATHTTGSDLTIGEVATFAITVALPEGALGQVVVTDLLPAGLAHVEGTVSVDQTGLAGSLGTVSTTTAGNDIVVTFSDVVVDSSPSTTDNTIVVTLDAIVTDVPGNVDGTVLENRGRVTVAGSQFTSDPVTVTVVQPQLVVSKTVEPDAAAVADAVTYRIEVTNTGSSTAFDMSVTDVVDGLVLGGLADVTTPAGWNLTSSTVGDATSLSWSSPDGLAPGTSATFSFAATVEDTITFPGTYVNTAGADGSSMPGSPGSARVVSAQDDATLTFTAVDIAVEKSASVTAADAGDRIVYSVEVANVGTRDATGVVLTDTLGDHVDFVSASDGGSNDAGIVTWPAFDLAVGATRTFTVTVDVDTPLPPGATSTVNTAGATDDGSHGPDPDPSNNSDSATVTLDAEVDVFALKSAGSDAVEPGGELSYTVTVGNAGARDAEDVTAVDTLGEHLEFVSATGGGVFDPDTRTITWSPLEVDGGASTDFDVVVRVAPQVPAGTMSVTNTVTVSHPDDVNPDNDTASTSTPVVAAPDLSVTKTDGSDVMLAGATVVYEITVANSGNRGASGVRVVDTLPDQVSFVSAAPSGTYDPDTRQLTWDVGVVDVGDVVALTLTVLADDPFPEGTTSVTNTVTVSDDGANGEDPNPGDNTDTDTDVTGADLVVDKELTTDSLTPGADATYVVSVTNRGPETVTQIVVDETYPAALSSPRFTPSEGEFDPVTMVWSGVSLAAGDTATLTVTFTVQLTAVGAVTNTVTVTPVGPADPSPDDATASTTDPVVPLVDLTLTKDLAGALVRGETAGYRFTVTNRGPSNATSVTVVDTLPPTLTFSSFTGDGWACVPTSDREVSCVLEGVLAPQQTATFELQVNVAADAIGTVVNTATVSAAEENEGDGALVASASSGLPPLPIQPGPEPAGPAGPGAPGGAPADPTGSGTLPRTGSDTWLLWWFAIGLIALGALLVPRARHSGRGVTGRHEPARSSTSR